MHELVAQLCVTAVLVFLLLARLVGHFFLQLCFIAVGFVIDPFQLCMFSNVMIWSSSEWAVSSNFAVGSWNTPCIFTLIAYQHLKQTCFLVMMPFHPDNLFLKIFLHVTAVQNSLINAYSVCMIKLPRKYSRLLKCATLSLSKKPSIRTKWDYCDMSCL